MEIGKKLGKGGEGQQGYDENGKFVGESGADSEESNDDDLLDYVEDDDLLDFLDVNEEPLFDVNDVQQYGEVGGLKLKKRKDFDPSDPAKGFESINNAEYRKLLDETNDFIKQYNSVALKSYFSATEELKELQKKIDKSKANFRKVSHNCQRCVVAFLLWCKGYEVHAGYLPKGDKLQSNDNYFKIFSSDYNNKNIQRNVYAHSVAGNIAHMNETTAGDPDGSIYIISILYSPTKGHVFNAIKEKGQLEFYDAQTGKKYNGSEYILKYTNKIRPTETEMTRVDELDIKDDFFVEGKQYSLKDYIKDYE